jgi:hypothetical protein
MRGVRQKTPEISEGASIVRRVGPLYVLIADFLLLRL